MPRYASGNPSVALPRATSIVLKSIPAPSRTGRRTTAARRYQAWQIVHESRRLDARDRRRDGTERRRHPTARETEPHPGSRGADERQDVLHEPARRVGVRRGDVRDEEQRIDDTLLFVANFAYAPNANAARRLVEHVLPLVRAARPGVRLCLAGGGMPPALRAIATAIPGIETPGFVDDLHAWYRRAAVVLLPVREGAGMLFKTIEALALGKATLGFPEAYRGIDADPESAFLTAPSVKA